MLSPPQDEVSEDYYIVEWITALQGTAGKTSEYGNSQYKLQWAT